MENNNKSLISILKRYLPRRQSGIATHDEEKKDGSNYEFFSSLLNTCNNLLSEIEEDITGYPSRMHQLGLDCGSTIIDPELSKPIIISIQKKYEAIGLALHKIIELDNAKSAKKIDILTGQVATLENATNESDENSEISKLRKKISETETSLKEYLANVYDKSFFEHRRKAIDEKIKMLDEDNKQLSEMVSDISAFVKQELDHLKSIIQNFFQSNATQEGADDDNDSSESTNQNDESTRRDLWYRLISRFNVFKRKRRKDLKKEQFKELKNLKKLKLILNEFPLLIDSVKNIYQKNLQSLRGVKSQIAENQRSISHSILKDEPLVLPKSQIFLYYIFSFVIFGGEVFLVYEYMTDSLGFDFKSDTGLSGLWSLPFIYLFSFAYPLALSMHFKESISGNSNNSVILNVWGLRIKVIHLIVAAVFSIGIPNSIVIGLDSYNAESGSNIGLADKIADILDQGNSPDNTNNVDSYTSNLILVSLAIYILAIAIFLPLMSIVLARVGAWVFSTAQDSHKKYLHITRQRLRDKDGRFKTELENEIGGLKKQISDLEKYKTAKQDELANAQAVSESSHADSTAAIKDIISVFKETAVQQFLTGFIIGKSQEEKFQDEEYLIRLKNKRKIFPFTFDDQTR